jgi:arylsulfatase
VERSGKSDRRADVIQASAWDWYLSKCYMLMAAQGLVEGFLKTFKEFPPRQKAASFTIDQAMEKMQAAWAGGSAAVAKTA